MTIYSLDVLLSQVGTSLLFHVRFRFFLTCIQISQEAGQVVRYSHLLKNFPQFVVIHAVKGFVVVSKAQFPGGSVVKTPPTNAENVGLIPGSGRSPGEGNGNRLQYSCLENPMDGGAWQATVHTVAQTQTQMR